MNRRATPGSILLHCILIAAFVCAQVPAFAEDPVEVEPAEAAGVDDATLAYEPLDVLPGRFTIGARAGEDEVEGMGDILVPVYRTASGLLFVNPRMTLNDRSEEEVNVGLGYRHLLGEKDVILGANLFYDSRWTANDNQFDQVGFGLEVLTRWVDARANYYLPDDEKEVIETFEEEGVIAVRSGSSTSAPYAEGHSIKETTTVTTRRTIRRETFEHFESTYEGYDVEAGVWLPLPEEGCPAEIGLFVGYYDFEPNFEAPDIDGVKGRVEVRALPAITLDAEVYENDELNGTDYFVGARVQVPFDLPNMANGGNPFEGTSDALRTEKRPFIHRLTENVIRDPQVRIGERTVKTGESTREEVDRDSFDTTLLPDVEFVDNRYTGIEKGTDGKPHNTIQEAVDAASGDKNIYVYAGAGPYVENVAIGDGVSVYGEGKGIKGSAGTFGGGAFPVVDGQVAGVNAPTIRVTGNDVKIQGLDVMHSPGGFNPGAMDAIFGTHAIDRVGILGENADNLRLVCNRIHDNSFGVLILSDPNLPGGDMDFNTTLLDNEITGNSEGGARVEAVGASGTFDARIFDNLFNDNVGSGLEVVAGGLDEAGAFILDNEANGNGVNTNPAANGIYVSMGGIATDLTIVVEGNTASSNTDDGIFVSAGGVGNDMMIIANENTADGNGVGTFAGSDGMFLSYGGVGGDVYVEVNENAPDRNTGNGIFLSGGGITGDHFLQINDNTLNNNGDGTFGGAVGLFAAVGGIGGDLDIEISRNSAVSNTDDGIFLSAGGIGNDLTLTVNENTASDNGLATFGGAFGVFASLGGIDDDLDVEMIGNRADRNTDDGMFLGVGDVDDDADFVLGDNRTVDNGAGGFNGAYGLFLDIDDIGDDLDISVSGHVARANSAHNINVTASNITDDVDVMIVDGTANDGGRDGIRVHVTEVGGSTDFLMDRIKANNNFRDGADVTLIGNGPVDTRLFDVSANGNLGGDGVKLAAISTGSLVTGLFAGVSAQNNDRDGLDVTLIGNGSVEASFFDIRTRDNLNGDGVKGTFTSSGSSVNVYFDGVTASENNRNGMNLRLLGVGQVVGGLEFVNANENANGDGIKINAQSLSSGVDVFAGFVKANGNAKDGIDARLTGDGMVLFDLFDASARNNVTGDGVRVVGVSSNAESVVFMVDVNASGNNRDGLDVRLQGPAGAGGLFEGITANNNVNGDGMLLVAESINNLAGMLLDEATLNGNGRDGLDARLLADDFIFVGITDVTAKNNLGGDGIKLNAQSANSGIMAFIDPIVASGNAQDGVDLFLRGDGPVTATLDDITAKNNLGGDGIKVNAGSVSSSVDLEIGPGNGSGNAQSGLDVDVVANTEASVVVTNFIARNNLGGDGVDLNITSVSGVVTVHVQNVDARGNAVDGIGANLSALTDVTLFGQNNILKSNADDGLHVNAAGGGTLTLDIGNGGLGSPGLNSFKGNGAFEVRNSGAGTVSAQSNFWGTAAGPIAGVDYSAPGVDAANFLASDPN